MTARRRSTGTVLAAAAFLAVAFIPVRSQLTWLPPATFGPLARMRLAWEMLAREAIAAGQLPWWNPYQFDGRPHLADPDTLVLYPPHLLLRFLPAHLFFPISFVIHVWAAGFGAYLAGRWLGWSRVEALVAAAAVLLGGVLAPRPELAYSAETFRLAWLPLIVAGTIRAAQQATLPPPALLVIPLALAAVGSIRGAGYALLVVAATTAAMWYSPAQIDRRRLRAQVFAAVALAAGLSAYQLFPALRLWSATAARGGLTVASAADNGPAAASLIPAPAVARLLATAGSGRVLSACPQALDGSQLAASHLRGVGGTGGWVSADYARIANLARGAVTEARPVYLGMADAGDEAARADLLAMLGAEYLVSCRAPDPSRWTPVAASDGVFVSRNRRALPRAFWTCAPQPVSRRALEQRLRRSEYDEALVLRAKSSLINVRWMHGVDDAARERLEGELHLAASRPLGDRTWQYELADSSPANIRAIVTHPEVEDTAHLDRAALALDAPAAADEPSDEWLLGGAPCEPSRAATIDTPDGVDGRMAIRVTAPAPGVLFIAGAHYPGRQAFVDGHRVQPLAVNLAFVAIPVDAGAHAITLQWERWPFFGGAAVSGLTLALWLFWAFA